MVATKQFGLSLTGEKELLRKLKLLTSRQQQRSIKKAILAAGRPMVKAAKSKAPRGKKRKGDNKKRKSLRQRIRVQQNNRLRPGEVAAATVKTAPHAHLVEFGTGERKNKKGKSSGKMPAQPFLGPAMEQTKSQVVEVFAAEINKAIQKVAR